MFLYIKQPGLIFRFHKKEYQTPIEFPFDKNNMQNLVMQLKNQSIDDFTISPYSIVSKKVSVVQKPHTYTEKTSLHNIGKDTNNLVINALDKLLLKINNVENKINNISNNNITIVDNKHKQTMLQNDNEDSFIPKIDTSDMDIKSNIKVEESQDNSDNVDILRQLLGGNK